MTTRVLVTGSRTWADEESIRGALEDVHVGLAYGEKPSSIVIVHGAAKGADAIADRVARELGYTVEEHPANWERDGRGAGVIRNANMVNLGAVLCLAFWDGHSRGTAHCIAKAVRWGIPVRIVPEKRR